jgi:hypothetical protein
MLYVGIKGKTEFVPSYLGMGIGRGVPLSVEHRMNVKEGIRRARMVAAV